jgi:hypothetical protein
MATSFPILLEVEPTALGGVLLKLKDLPGVKIHLDLDKAGRPKKVASRPAAEHNGHHPRTKKNPDGPSGKTIIITELMSGQKNLAHLKAKFEEHSLSSGNVSSTLHAMTEKGITDHIGPGLYRLSEKALKEFQQEAVLAEALQLPPPTDAKAKRGDSVSFVLKGISEGKTRSEMIKAGEPLGINERMIDGALTRLKAKKLIAAVEDAPGHFNLVPQKTPKTKQSQTKE